MNPAKCQAGDYIDFLVASPRVVSGTEAARTQPDGRAVAHDAYTRLLHRLEPDPEALWGEAAGRLHVKGRCSAPSPRRRYCRRGRRGEQARRA